MREKRLRITPILLSAMIIIFSVSCSNKAENSIQTCKVKKGAFDIEVAETGELAAVNAINISSPAMSWRYGIQKIIKILKI